jgi:drug/metabolite transporter (DMT)-like permease
MLYFHTFVANMVDTNNKTIRQAYFKIHLAVLLFGFTAILGDLIKMPAIMIVWWRVLITSISLLFFIRFGKDLVAVGPKLIKKYVFIGILIGSHWICFYGSIKLSNASVCLVSMSTTSFFTAWIEPLLVRTKFNKYEIITGLLIIPAMALIANTLDSQYLTGLMVGLLSALLAAVFSVLNRANISGASPFTISFIELTSAWVMITGVLLAMYLFGQKQTSFLPNGTDWFYLIILALVCTTLAHVLSLQALRYITAFDANLVINLEPIYGILLAVTILHEHKELNPMFFVGAAIILLTVIFHPFLIKKSKPKI